MADDHTQRPYRPNESYGRAAPSAAPAPASGNDPLAELARLIGQNDFSEFGRDSARRSQAGAPPVPGYSPPVAPDARAPQSPPGYSNGGGQYAEPSHAPQLAAPQYDRQQPYANPSFAPGGDVYRTARDEQHYDPHHQDGSEDQDDRYFQNQAHLQSDEHEDIYDEPPRSGRRVGIMAIAAIFALAVIGTAGAFGYRALFGSSVSDGPPPVIKADTAPSKIVPASNSQAQSTKLSYDRVGGNAQGEKLVSREEQPVDMKEKQAAMAFPQAQQQQPTMGSGVIGDEPKKIRTIAIRPEDVGGSSSVPPAAATPAPAPSKVTMVTPRVTAPRSADADIAPSPAPVQTQAPAPRVINTSAPAARQAAAPAANAPLSLSPNSDTPAPAARAPAPARAAAPAAPRAAAQPAMASTGGGGYAVQVSSQRSETEAQAAFRGLQGKYPDQLGNRQPLIHRVDLGDKGIYYRAMVGPFADANEAGTLCSNLKAAGGQCIVQRN